MSDAPFFIRKVNETHVRLIVGSWASLPFRIYTDKFDTIWDAGAETQRVRTMVRRYLHRTNAPAAAVEKVEAWYDNLEK